MTGNPVLRLVESPVATLVDVGWVLILLAALVATWWAAGRNALYLEDNYQQGWRYLIPAWYAIRVIGMLLIIACDLWLLAAIATVIG
jgi:hypothetical protein